MIGFILGILGVLFGVVMGVAGGLFGALMGLAGGLLELAVPALPFLVLIIVGVVLLQRHPGTIQAPPAWAPGTPKVGVGDFPGPQPVDLEKPKARQAPGQTA